MDSCFALVGARQHSVAKICNASQEPTHINCKMTRSLYQVPCFELTCAPKHALPDHVLRSCFIGSGHMGHVGVSKRFPVVSALQSIAFIHIFLADQISCRSYFGSVYRTRSLAVYSHSFNIADFYSKM